jgi:hypothetical protein
VSEGKTHISTHDGVVMLLWFCPGCKCGHGVPVTGPRAWAWNGDREAPTLGESVRTNARRANPFYPICRCELRDGVIHFCADSTHALAGTKVPLEAA